MVNEEKLRQMTKLAIYEKNEGKKALEISSFYRWDYVTMQMVKGWIYSTIAIGIMAVIELLYRDFAVLDRLSYGIGSFVIPLLVHYLILEGLYQVLCFVIYNIRYTRGKNCMKQYYYHLIRILRFYKREGSDK